MKKYIFFSLKILALFLMLEFLAIFVITQIQRSYSFRVSPLVHKIVVGHSMTESSINDSIYKGALNVSESGVELNLSYVKLKKILSLNDQIDTVILGIRPTDLCHNFFKESGLKYMKLKLPKYLFLFSIHDMSYFKTDPNFYASLSQVPLQFVITLSENSFHYHSITDHSIGKFEKRYGCNIKIPSTEYVDYDMNDTMKFDPLTLTFFNQIVTLCQEHNVSLICMTPPMYMSKTNVYFQNYMTSRHIDYLDLSTFRLPHDDFYDEQHLNHLGADAFSNALDSIIQRFDL